ncbi:hypothetical protein B0H63DRAFT_419297 [Podospora didyma]|uniref:Nudix hydrolase domain-containing protein n=1 Tax=Podospora didyma TaxID=330526 RepID=A0AAE0KEX5_9PEZI|nr:hypothetical protein B0H63DRAFT_419297 [Podospora didyma]
MSEPKMQLEDWLDDLCVRFIINLPKEDLSSVARICFQVEEAQWFYEDFIRPLDPTLPSMTLRTFCLRIFQHCPLLASFSVENHMRAFEEFLTYKTRVPVRGAILLNEDMDSTVLVKGWKKGANWSFPRGKINKDEDDLDCAIREVYEETGFDIKEAGLVPKDDEVKYIQISMREQQIRLYVFRNIPMDTFFQPRTRKEISKIQWYKLSELPAFRKKGSNQAEDMQAASTAANKFYMVAPFLVPLKKWVLQQKKKDSIRAPNHSHLAVQVPFDEPLTEDDLGMQTEPISGPPNTTSSIETLEGATLELQRLLKVQPPTQGLQMSPAAATIPDKGEALMAILQKKDEASFQLPPQAQPGHPQQPQQPHTPFDLTYSNAPEPHTPRHHHPTQRLHVSEYQPPPNFPLPPTIHHQNGPAGYYNQARAPPQAFHQNQQQFYGRNPYMNPGQMPRKEPVLLHPQPLPPRAQQSILTRGIMPTPNIPDASRAPPQTHQIGPNSYAMRNPEPPQFQQQQGGKLPAQLTNHKISLLNAFKTENKQSSENQAPANTSRGDSTTQSQYSSSARANMPAPQAPNAAAKYLPHPIAPAGQLRSETTATQLVASIAASASISKPALPTDPHRSSLLDMFKKPVPAQASSASSDSTVVPGMSKAAASFAPEEEYGNPSAKPRSAAETLAFAASHTNTGGPVRMNPEVNLPYRAVQILSRPKQAEADKGQAPAPMHIQSQSSASTSSGRHDVRDTTHASLPSPRTHSLLYKSETQEKKTALVSHQSPVQTLSSTHSVSSFQLHQPPASNPEQKQKLLSLFGKAQPSPTAFSAAELVKGKDPVMFDQIRSATPRSRLASLASVPGDSGPGSAPTSRRGSQTPISPADRNFLLSYLENVTSGGR